LRERPAEEGPRGLVLAAADPAQPYGAVLPWPRRAGGRAARVAGALVVLLDGEPGLYVERGGKTVVPLRDPEPGWVGEALAALVDHARRTRLKRLAVERFDGVPVLESDVVDLLVEAGFRVGPRRAVLHGS
jgi:ATP-dependent Lhr-like helicase